MVFAVDRRGNWNARRDIDLATFSTQAGTLSGTPTAAGVGSGIRIYARVNSSRVSLAPFSITNKPAFAATYSNIGIAVSDGNASASLAPFTRAVTAH